MTVLKKPRTVVGRQTRGLLATAVVLLVAASGSYWMQAGRAATLAASKESESGQLAGNAVARSDGAASGGAAVGFGMNSSTGLATCSVSQATGATANRQFVPAGLTTDNSGDNTSAIQVAINQASSAGGGTVALAAGIYRVNGHLTVKSNVRLQGAGSSTVIKAGPDFMKTEGPHGGFPLISADGATNVTIADLTADQSGDTLDGNAKGEGDRLTAYLVEARDSSNIVISGVSTRNPFTYSIVILGGSTKFCVNGNTTRVATSGTYNQLDGVHILDSSFGDVINNDIDQRVGTDGDDGLVAHVISGPVHDVTYANNKVRGGNNGNGMQIALGNFPAYNLRIINNEFYGAPFGIRTGYYENGTGAVHDVLIDGNNIHDLKPGNSFPNGGDAVNIGGFGAIGAVTNITVTNNTTCKAGTIKVNTGSGNVVKDNKTC